MSSKEQVQGEIHLLNPKRVRLFREPDWALRLTLSEDRSYPKVKVVRAFPLSRPDQYIAFLDVKDEEIGTIKDPKTLDEASREILREELDKRYLGAVIQSIRSVRNEFGTSYWDVETHRGPRDFVVKNVLENVLRLGEHRLLLVDVDSNHFEIPDVRGLDKWSRSLLNTVL